MGLAADFKAAFPLERCAGDGGRGMMPATDGTALLQWDHRPMCDAPGLGWRVPLLAAIEAFVSA